MLVSARHNFWFAFTYFRGYPTGGHGCAHARL
jgi:hypothetical protein